LDNNDDFTLERRKETDTETIQCDICGFDFHSIIKTQKSDTNACFNCFNREFGKDRLVEFIKKFPDVDDYYIKGGFEPINSHSERANVNLNGITIRIAYSYLEWLQYNFHNDPFAIDFSFGKTRYDDIISEFSEFSSEHYIPDPSSYDRFIGMEVLDRIQHMGYSDAMELLKEIQESNAPDNTEQQLAKQFSTLVIHINEQYLKDKYGICPECRERGLDGLHKDYSKVCSVCHTKKAYERLMKIPEKNLEKEYDTIYNELRENLPSRNYYVFKELMQLTISQKVPNNIIENALMNKFHKIERHPSDQWGWCKYCKSFHRQGFIPEKPKKIIGDCTKCLSIIGDKLATNMDIAVPLRTHIRKDHSDLFKIIEDTNVRYFEWDFISPIEEEKRIQNKFDYNNPDATEEEIEKFRRSRDQFIKRSYIFDDTDEYLDDIQNETAILPSLKGYRIDNGNDREPHKEMLSIFQHRVWKGGIRSEKDYIETADKFANGLREGKQHAKDFLKNQGGSKQWIDSLIDRVKHFSKQDFERFKIDFAHHLGSKKEVSRAVPKYLEREMLKCRGCKDFAEKFHKEDSVKYVKLYQEHITDAHPEFFLYIGKGTDQNVKLTPTVNAGDLQKQKGGFSTTDLPLDKPTVQRPYRFTDNFIEKFSEDFSKFLKPMLNNQIKFKTKFKRYSKDKANHQVSITYKI